MKIVPILAITNALALALAVFLYVKQDELSSKLGSRRSDVVRSDTAGTADLEMRIAELERAMAARGHEPAAAPDAPAHGAPSAPGGAAVHGGSDAPPLASPASGNAADPAAAAGDEVELGPQEMQVFRKNVKKAIDLNDEEEQKNRVIDRLDELVKENRIAPLNPHQKEGVATTVLAYRKKIPDVWKKLRESGAFENTSREDQGKMFRSEFDALRADAQRSLEEFIPAADAKTYLDDSLRDAVRFGGRAAGGFGGRDNPQAPRTRTMIRRSLPDGDLLITQAEHALQAGRLAAGLRDVPEPREPLIRAVALHDAGWSLLDDRPEPLPDGRTPHIFDHDTGQSTPAWRRSVAVARASGPLEALLVSRHFSRFSARFAAEQADLQAAWRLGVPPDLEEEGVRLLRYCDSLSLRLLCDPKERVNLPQDVTYEDGWLSPWPFVADTIEDTVTGRQLPKRKWGSKGELMEAYRAAPVIQWTVKLLPI